MGKPSLKFTGTRLCAWMFLLGFCSTGAGCLGGSRTAPITYDYPLKASIMEKVKSLDEASVRALLGTPYQVDTYLESKERRLVYERSSQRNRPPEILRALVLQQGDKRFSYELKPDRETGNMAVCGFSVILDADGAVIDVATYEKRDGDCKYLGELPSRVVRKEE